MKIVSWNVNGLRACMNKGFMDFFRQVDADVFCVQEIKLQQGDIALDIDGYHGYWSYADRKGYSGTAVFCKDEPQRVIEGIGVDMHDREGRTLTLDYGAFYLVGVYVPNAGQELKRLDYRMQWDDDFRAYLLALKREKPVVVTGDFNVAHQEIDLKNPDTNHRTAGFTDEERGKFSQLLDAGFTDGFRQLYPDAVGKYTYWSYRFGSRGRNAGWRIDYGCFSGGIAGELKSFDILSDVMGSDHCPIVFEVF